MGCKKEGWIGEGRTLYQWTVRGEGMPLLSIVVLGLKEIITRCWAVDLVVDVRRLVEFGRMAGFIGGER